MNEKGVWRKIFDKYEVGDLVILKGTDELARITAKSVGWDPMVYYVRFLNLRWRGWVSPKDFVFLNTSSDRTELMVQLTYICNLNCKHCAYGDLLKTSHLIYGEIKGFLERYDPKLIKLSGGEPTITDFFPEVIKLCRSTGAKVISFTNGLKWPKIDPDAYWVSLYGKEKTHNSITRANTFSRTMKFIKSHNVEYLNSPVFNLTQMWELKELSKELDIPLRITQLLPHGNCKEVLSGFQQREIVQKLRLNRKPHWVTCSLGFEPPRCKKKMCLKPDGSEVICTYLIRGLRCPFASKRNR